MGVDISLYCARIGSFAAKYKKKDTTESWKVETDGWQTWFWGLVLIVLLVIGGMEANPGPSVGTREIRSNYNTYAKSGKGV
jgi:hypothetical protein